MQVMIAIPSHDMVPMRFAGALAALCAFPGHAFAGTPEINILLNTYVYDARERLAEQAVASGASHVLWIDSDMTFPRDALLRLLTHDVAMVGINYSTRVSPPVFVAKANGARVRTSGGSTGLQEVEGVGFGLVLMRTIVLEMTMDAGAPIFGPKWIPERKQFMGEDFAFCERARAAGVAIYVDHDLSKECAHIGAREFRTSDALEATA